MPHVITSLCLREGACLEACPVDCIVPGSPTDKWPRYYVDPVTCIDCSACEPECPYGAILPGFDVPTQYKAQEGERLNMPVGTPGFDEEYHGEDHEGNPVHLKATRTLKEGEIVDLTIGIEDNAKFFENGPGYNALD